MYKIIALVSTAVRQFCMPNPFEPGEYAFLINILAEPVVHAITYIVAGLFYENHEFPVIGSLLYLGFYCIHTGLLMLMGVLHWHIVAIIIIVVLYVCILAVVSKLIELIRFP